VPIAVSGAIKPPRVVQLTTRDHGSSSLVNGIMTPAEPLLYQDLLQSVAVAAGRLTEVNKPITSPDLSGLLAPSIEEASRNNRLILLAEDNEINQEVIQAQLRFLGYTSELAEDGLQALTAWRSGRYALLLTDFHMPNMDGHQLTAAIRAEENAGQRLPIIAITADAIQGEAERCIENGMSDYLSKPLRLAELAAMLAKWLPHADQLPAAPAAEAPSVTPQQILVWDPDVLPKTMGGDAAYHRKLLDKFVLRAEAYVNELAAAIRTTDPSLVADVAHKLKSPALSVGAMQLGDLCGQLETAGRENDLQTIAALAEHLDAFYRAAAEAIRVA
jgi:CheY-like chemotaxis protein/HPt (histidine-containing phosphotransfer) domain-containing protein